MNWFQRDETTKDDHRHRTPEQKTRREKDDNKREKSKKKSLNNRCVICSRLYNIAISQVLSTDFKYLMLFCLWKFKIKSKDEPNEPTRQTDRHTFVYKNKPKKEKKEKENTCLQVTKRKKHNGYVISG